MKLSKELQETINVLFENDEEIKEKLLSGDADTIRKIGSASQTRMNPEDIVAAYESNDSEMMENVYKEAKKLVELQKLYKALCIEYSKANRSENKER